MSNIVKYPSTKFLTQDGKPLHPITDTEGYVPGDRRVMVRACLHQSLFSDGQLPPIGDDDRYIWVSVAKWKYDLLPEGTYSLNMDTNEVIDIDAPSVPATLFLPEKSVDQYEEPNAPDPVVEALTDVMLQARALWEQCHVSMNWSVLHGLRLYGALVEYDKAIESRYANAEGVPLEQASTTSQYPDEPKVTALIKAGEDILRESKTLMHRINALLQHTRPDPDEYRRLSDFQELCVALALYRQDIEQGVKATQ